ncbi:MAG: HAD-IIIA family hydrolase [Candidatus Omnitrophica bacterium]|nr:HAD-IIIA family hydrolase [Candidatus Omnitrophota bacterium]
MLGKYSKEIIEKAEKIKVLILDVDGVLTDGSLIYTRKGEEIKKFNVNDGLGVLLIRRAGIRTVILTAKASPMVRKRAKDLKVDKVFQNFHDKGAALKKILRKFRAGPEQICFIGDDVIDIPVLRRVGLAVSPPGAMHEAREVAHLITARPGGAGAVREVCELILRSQGKWIKAIERYKNG